MHITVEVPEFYNSCACEKTKKYTNQNDEKEQACHVVKSFITN